MPFVREDISEQVNTTDSDEESAKKLWWKRRREQRRRLLELLEKEWKVHGG